MNVAAYLDKIKEAIIPWSRNSFLDAMNLIASPAEFKRLIAIERCRVNRSGGVFTLVVFNLDKIQLQIKSLSKLTATITRRARISDRMGWYDNGLLGLILPETPISGAQKFIRDLYNLNRNGMPRPKVDLYVYPSDKPLSPPIEKDLFQIQSDTDFCSLENK